MSRKLNQMYFDLILDVKEPLTQIMILRIGHIGNNSVKMGIKEIIGLYIISYHVNSGRNEDIKDIPIEGGVIKRLRGEGTLHIICRKT